MKLNKIYNTDCLEFMRSMPDSCVDLVVTDPPYEIHTKGGGLGKRPVYENGALSKISQGFDAEATLEQIARICKKINIFIFCSTKQKPRIMNWGYERDCNIAELAWYKPNAAPFTNNTFKSDLENIIYIREKGVKIKGISRLFTHNCGKSKYGHPTEKPLEIIEKLILTASNEGDLIFDPFMGSGTTAAACKELNRNFIGCEIESKYCEIAEKRLRKTIRGLL
ncbi:DNA-methyltransferase [Campylobacter gracilis]|uniref:Methyltransferase n=1 Tax=Campylobacter gracilis RM3268 TaxID=553220 RepID=C8PFG1_9BACT|nr:site-specific DNA-methyltransferase [Campylobacter gracilis]AKT91692.1 DNA methyltransferase [Campylobacter gracilis]EEV18427.1 DNA (cytosine-5-)-methyltransferase [Campylobacter gracilis RM3268]UEB46099.1 site-specific DNA-methyltransferase [Campylobacter gracilis]SUW77857.1 DNA methylase [Campylobacter gracilis]